MSVREFAVPEFVDHDLIGLGSDLVDGKALAGIPDVLQELAVEGPLLVACAVARVDSDLGSLTKKSKKKTG